jgi:2-dehydropantoate 2-reductase
MQWTVLGPGAMGCLWAYYLSQQTAPQPPFELSDAKSPDLSPVQLIGRRFEQAQVIDLHKSGINGTHTITASLTSVKALEQSEQPFQGLLISTKAFDTCQAFASLAPYLSEACCIVVLCNGIHAQQHLAKQFPNHKLYALVTAVGAYLTAPFKVVHAGLGESYIGPLTTSAQAQPITDFPLSTQWDPQIHQRMVDKLSINAVINPLTAIHQCVNGDLLTKPYLAEFQQLAYEVEILLNAEGLRCSQPVLTLATSVAEKTANNYSSTYQDVFYKRQTELMAFTGFLQDISLKHNIKAPQHEVLMRTFNHLNIQL